MLTFFFAISFTKPEFYPEYVYFAVGYFGNTQCIYPRHLLHYVTQVVLCRDLVLDNWNSLLYLG